MTSGNAVLRFRFDIFTIEVGLQKGLQTFGHFVVIQIFGPQSVLKTHKRKSSTVINAEYG